MTKLTKIGMAKCRKVKNPKKEGKHKMNSVKVQGKIKKSSAKSVKHAAITKKCTPALNMIISAEQQDEDSLVYAVKSLGKTAPFFVHVPKLCKSICKGLTVLWSTKSARVRNTSKIVLQKISGLRKNFYQIIYKDCYRAYISECKNVDETTTDRIIFLQTSFVELTLFKPAISYELAFVYVRQFAIHMRNAIISKKKDITQSIYNWQFLKGLELWALVLCKAKSALKDDHTISKRFLGLCLPLVEIITTVRRLFPSTKYLPLRIHCVKILSLLRQALNVHIPIITYSFDLLDDMLELSFKKPTAGKGSNKMVKFDHLLRLTNITLMDASYQQFVAKELFDLCEKSLDGTHFEYISANSKLRKFLKNCKRKEFLHIFRPLQRRLKL